MKRIFGASDPAPLAGPEEAHRPHAPDESSHRAEPNFFGVGAGKAGTTSLWMYLKQHPEIGMPKSIDVKEPSYFCDLYGFDDFDAYLRLFSHARGKKAIGETSHSYLTSPESAAWIRRVYPDARIFMILRNPVDRAFALHGWMVSEGHEWITSFELALEEEEHRLTDEGFKRSNPQGYWYNYLYFHSGLYFEQVKRYLDIFPRHQVHIMLFEDLQHRPLGTVQDLYAFLGVDATFVPAMKVHNARQHPLFPPLQFSLRRRLPRRLRRLGIPEGLVRPTRDRMMELNRRLGSSKARPMQPETRSTLRARYAADIRRTADLTGRDLTRWLEE